MHQKFYGPTLRVAQQIHQDKYRLEGEDFNGAMARISSALSDNSVHHANLLDILLHQRFLPAGRIQSGAGSNKSTTLFNCFVSGTIEDNFTGPKGIMARATEAAQTMRMGGGVGYDFGTLRPRGDLIKSLNSQSSGPVSFMEIYDAVCRTVSSSGHRRGAQMGVLPVSHPDIEEFIRAKRNSHKLTGFNISVGITDEFMRAVQEDTDYKLRFNGTEYKSIRARLLWDDIMQSTWDYAEPGVIFLDRINEFNNLWYCEDIKSTNPSMPAGTLVHTKNGICEIQKLENTEFEVRVFDGTFHKANCFLSSPSAPIFEINFGGVKTIKATAEHKWPIYSNGRFIKTTTSELQPGDFIPLNVGELPHINSKNTLDEMDGFFLGMLFGDGWFNWRKESEVPYLGFIFNSNQIELAEKIKEYLNTRYNKNVNITQPEGAEYYIQTTGVGLNELFSKFKINKYDDKTMFPKIVWESSDAFIYGFIDGLFSSDGCIEKAGRISFCNKSELFVKNVARLLSFCGIKTTRSNSKTILRNYDKTYFRTDLYIHGKSCETFAKLFSFSFIEKQIKLDKLIEYQKNKRRKSFEYTNCEEVLSITKISDGEPVWDISVEHADHVFPTEWVTTGNCSEQPLPPHGACLLGSFNLVQYIRKDPQSLGALSFDWTLFIQDIFNVVRAMDNAIDISNYPLVEQKDEANAKRRMGLGITGYANASEILGWSYGSTHALKFLSSVCRTLRDFTYRASIELAREKGAFPLLNKEKYLDGKYVSQLPDYIKENLWEVGIRNSHLTSIAPTGTISITADNVSSGIEPPFSLGYDRTIQTFNGPVKEFFSDYAYRVYGVVGKTADQCTVDEHLSALTTAQQYIDSAVSKTVNVGPNVTFEQFEDIYMKAYKGGAKGLSTFRMNGKRTGILEAREQEQKEEPSFMAKERSEEPTYCTMDPTTGERSCG